MPRIYTIGHSSHSAEHFLGLLQQHRIELLVDTRSTPASSYSPQFDREAPHSLVAAAKMKYLYLGDVIGGRPKGPSACELHRQTRGHVAHHQSQRGVLRLALQAGRGSHRCAGSGRTFASRARRCESRMRLSNLC